MTREPSITAVKGEGQPQLTLLALIGPMCDQPRSASLRETTNILLRSQSPGCTSCAAADASRLITARK